MLSHQVVSQHRNSGPLHCRLAALSTRAFSLWKIVTLMLVEGSGQSKG